MKKTVGEGAERGCLLLAEAEGCSCCFLSPVGAKMPQNLPVFLPHVEKPSRQESLEWEKGKNPVLLVWAYVVCHPCLAAWQGGPLGNTTRLFLSRRPPPSRWCGPEEICLAHFSPLWSKRIICWGTLLHLFYFWLTESTDCPYNLSPQTTS